MISLMKKMMGLGYSVLIRTDPIRDNKRFTIVWTSVGGKGYDLGSSPEPSRIDTDRPTEQMALIIEAVERGRTRRKGRIEENG